MLLGILNLLYHSFIHYTITCSNTMIICLLYFSILHSSNKQNHDIIYTIEHSKHLFKKPKLWEQAWNIQNHLRQQKKNQNPEIHQHPRDKISSLTKKLILKQWWWWMKDEAMSSQQSLLHQSSSSPPICGNLLLLLIFQ